MRCIRDSNEIKGMFSNLLISFQKNTIANCLYCYIHALVVSHVYSKSVTTENYEERTQVSYFLLLKYSFIIQYAYYQNCFLPLEVNICFPILFANFRNLSCFILLFIRATLFRLSIINTNAHLSTFYGFIHFIRKHVSISRTIKQILHDFEGFIMAIFISPRKILEKPYIFLFHVPVTIM